MFVSWRQCLPVGFEIPTVDMITATGAGPIRHPMSEQNGGQYDWPTVSYEAVSGPPS